MPESAPGVELDHIIVLCAPGAPEADALIRKGLEEGSANAHPGQGTACRRFFFANAYLELLWVTDPEQAQSPIVRDTGLWDHWSQRASGACPFGLVLRPAGSGEAIPPFDTWTYRPGYLPPPLAIEVASANTLNEPLLFYLGFQRSRARMEKEPTIHELPVGLVTQVSIGRPGGARPVAAMLRAAAFAWLSLNASDQYVIDITFDRGQSGRASDLRPEMPLILHW